MRSDEEHQASKPQPPKTAHARLFEQCENWKQRPFLDAEPMIGDPSCNWDGFRYPMLRKCPLSPDKVRYESQLGYGFDGVIWKVTIDDKAYALKVFWDHKAPPGIFYWAIQRESHNAALIKLICTSISTSSEPIRLNPRPETHRDAVRNLRAFSTEGRSKFRDMPDAATYSVEPRFRDCFGWMMIRGGKLCSLGKDLRPPGVCFDRVWRQISPVEDHYAILYEFIPPTELTVNIESMQAQVDLLWLAGFCVPPIYQRNWANGVMLDMTDPVSPWEPGWFQARYKRHVIKPPTTVADTNNRTER